MTLPYPVRYAADKELASLRRFAARTGDSLAEMIAIPDDVRCTLDEFCREYPQASEDIQLNIAIRDYMLERVAQTGDVVYNETRGVKTGPKRRKRD